MKLLFILTILFLLSNLAPACSNSGNSNNPETDSGTDTDTDTDTDSDTDSNCSKITTFEDGLVPTEFLHVSTTGSDSSGDGSNGNPFATLDYAASLATPGTAVVIHEGTYSGGNYINDLNGTSDQLIWIGGADTENKPVISGGGEGLHLSRASYLIIHDLEVTGASSNGINSDDGGDRDNETALHHIIFRDLYIHNIGSNGNEDCLKLSGINDYFVLNSEITDCGGGGSGSAIDHVGCHKGLIANNSFHDLSGNAIQCKGGSYDIEIRWNHMVDAGARSVNMGGSTGFEFFRPSLSTAIPNFEAKNIRVVSNIIEGSTASLAFVGCVECKAVNNTIINPDNWIFRILQETTSADGYDFLPCSDNLVQNNILYFDHSNISTYINIGPNVSEDTFTFITNLWYAHDNPDNSLPTLPVTETGAITGQDPLFDVNFNILAGSPALGAGTTWDGLTGDINGVCYEYPPSIGAVEGN